MALNIEKILICQDFFHSVCCFQGIAMSFYIDFKPFLCSGLFLHLFCQEIGKNVQNGKTEQTPKASFGVWIPEGVQRRSSCFYFVSANRRNSFYTRLLLYKIEKYFSILRGKTATKVSNGTLDIANILKRVLTWYSELGEVFS